MSKTKKFEAVYFLDLVKVTCNMVCGELLLQHLCIYLVFYLFIYFLGQVFDRKAPHRPDAVILTQPGPEGNSRTLLVGGQPHRDSDSGAVVDKAAVEPLEH